MNTSSNPNQQAYGSVTHKEYNNYIEDQGETQDQDENQHQFYGYDDEDEEESRKAILSDQNTFGMNNLQINNTYNNQPGTRAINNYPMDVQDAEDNYDQDVEEQESLGIHQRAEYATEFEGQQYEEGEEVMDQQRDDNERQNKSSGKDKSMKFTNLATGSVVSNIDAVGQNEQYRSQLISKLKQDDSYLEPSQADISHQNPHITEISKEEDDTHSHDQHQQQQQNQDSVSQREPTQEDLELIKPSKYYQKFLNGESLNESYSVLASNLMMHSSLQNTTGQIDNQSLLQGGELNVLKVKLFESNNKLMQEMNKNREFSIENAALKKSLDNVTSQLIQAQNALNENNQKLQQQQQQTNNNNNNIFATTFGSPSKINPIFNNLSQNSSNELQVRFEEEQTKNNNLRKDLETLRTRLLQEMNNTGQIEQKSREMEQVITELQQSLQRRDQMIQEKTEEVKKLTYIGDTFQGEFASLQAKLKKSSDAQDDIQAANRQLQMENQDLKGEVKSLQAKMSNFSKDNHSLFQEIQILKQKVLKAEANSTETQATLYQQKAEITQNNRQQTTLLTKQQQIIFEKNSAEINELKVILQATQKQLETQKDRNEYLSQKLQEQEHAIIVNNQNKQQNNQRQHAEWTHFDQQQQRQQQQKIIKQNSLNEVYQHPSYSQQRAIYKKNHQQQGEINEESQQQQQTLGIQQSPSSFNNYQQQEHIPQIGYQNSQYQPQMISQQPFRNQKNNTQEQGYNQNYENEYEQPPRQQQFQPYQRNEQANYLKREVLIPKNELEEQYFQAQQRNAQDYVNNQQPVQRKGKFSESDHQENFENINNKQRTSYHSPPSKDNQRQQKQNSQQYQPNIQRDFSSKNSYQQYSQDYSQQNIIPNKSATNTRDVKSPERRNYDEFFYQNLVQEKNKLQEQEQYMPIGVTSSNQTGYLSNTSKIKELDAALSRLLQEKNQVESELLKLEESKRKSSSLIQHKQELERKLNQLSIQVSAAKNQLRSLHALK